MLDMDLALCRQRIERLERDNKQLHDNLTSVQERCTELVEEVRELRRIMLAAATAGEGGR